ncbi:hypothetical protein Taro_037170 [Colocasia esculenta]|uniref:Uncharacterized protein n=1 Tax=Colocasia esculenta TaxID=4460 RepID=A0A843WIF0_COLES|nr:hypothetical protein [Colocasia esculenta]
MQGEDRSRICFPLYYIVAIHTCSRTSGLVEEFPLSIQDLLFDMFMRYMFMREEDLLRARAVWESTAQNNFRKLLWESRDKVAKIVGSQDPTAWIDYGPVWMWRDYWESLYHRWATRPWQERSQAAKRNQITHLEKNVHTSGSLSYVTHSQKLHYELERAPKFRELFDQTHKQKEMDDYISARETYDRMMVDRYTEGTPQPDLDPEAWVDAGGGPRKGRVYGFGDNLDTTPVLSSYASSVAPPGYVSSFAATPRNGGDDIRTLIWEELSQQLPLHLGAMVEQLVAAIRGAGTSQQAPQFE